MNREELLPTSTGAEARRNLGRLLRPPRLLGSAAIATLVAVTAIGLVGPALLGRIVDVVTEHRPASAVTGPVIGLALVALGEAVLSAFGDVLVARLGETM